MKITHDPKGRIQVWKKNKLVGFVDEDDVLYRINPNTGFAEKIGLAPHEAEIIKVLKNA